MYKTTTACGHILNSPVLCARWDSRRYLGRTQRGTNNPPAVLASQHSDDDDAQRNNPDFIVQSLCLRSYSKVVQQRQKVHTHCTWRDVDFIYGLRATASTVHPSPCLTLRPIPSVRVQSSPLLSLLIYVPSKSRRTATINTGRLWRVSVLAQHMDNPIYRTL